MKITKTKLKQIIKEELKQMVDPFSAEEQEAHSDAYYELFEFLKNSSLPGDKPSEKIHSALRWIAKFEEGIDESYGSSGRLGAYDCERGPCRGLSGMELERCVTKCIERKNYEADKRAEKSMSRGW